MVLCGHLMLAMLVVQSGEAFHIPFPKSLSSSSSLVVLSLLEDNNKNGGNDDFGFIGDDGESFEGSKLASEFFDQVQKREQGLSREPSPYDNTDVSKFSRSIRLEEEEEEKGPNKPKPPQVPEVRVTDEDLRKLVQGSSSAPKKNEPFSRRREVSGGSDVGNKSPPKKYFTGASQNESSSAGFFTGRGPSVFSTPDEMNTNPRARMMKNEMDLLSRSEQSIGAQALLALLLLGVYVAVGLTGGITDGSEREVLNMSDTSMEGIQQLLPQPTDTETSVW
eukprot:CAMPEP_0194027860 /NCGR_PEP_ID=MMETSP0009_2-20130614/1899_1 /TAXON_ID=210454 /ORGANISM="Grammatophora oceanica, Strain CCMP 410" /LENGTH=277 /DNA_ID=CAMNT_0038667039 /DNA_START=120 /DNA_END=950 /DNA_ORIENTATION=+